MAPPPMKLLRRSSLKDERDQVAEAPAFEVRSLLQALVEPGAEID